MNEFQSKHIKRPKWVWAISFFYFISAIYTLLSLYLIHTGAIPIPEATKAYLDSLTTIDHIITIVIWVVILVGAISLFFLRKMAYPLFLISFVVNILMSLWHMLSKNMLSALVSGGAIGMIIGWGMLLAVCLYAKKLAKLGVLR